MAFFYVDLGRFFSFFRPTYPTNPMPYGQNPQAGAYPPYGHYPQAPSTYTPAGYSQYPSSAHPTAQPQQYPTPNYTYVPATNPFANAWNNLTSGFSNFFSFLYPSTPAPAQQAVQPQPKEAPHQSVDSGTRIAQERVRNEGFQNANFVVPSSGTINAGATSVSFGALAAAVHHRESTDGKNLISQAGALGDMQVMPATGAMVAGQLGIRDPNGAPYTAETIKARLLTDTPFNMRLGLTYLHQQLEAYDKNPYVALVAYNAGPAVADKMLQMHGVPNADTLPQWLQAKELSAETRAYVPYVMDRATSPAHRGDVIEALGTPRTHAAAIARTSA